jgi:alginate O-acetyltransferase complex protein AlgI
MQFNSGEYFLFLAAVLFLYYGAAKNYPAQRRLVVIASALFYAMWSTVFLVYFFAVVTLNYYAAKRMMDSSDPNQRKRILGVTITLDLANLFFFKYAGLFADSTNWFGARFGLGQLIQLPEIILPLAISFYTFHLISFLVDIHRQKIHARPKGLQDFLFYVTFFPHQIAGPILRGEELFPQLRYVAWDWAGKVRPGLERLLVGLFQKAVVADNLAVIADHGYRHYATLSAAEIYVVLIAYTFQIFFDFAGYSNMGIGAAKMMGYTLPENFNTPYIARNISDFWRRWHMTLSRWIRDYIFIPLGGSKDGNARTNFNLLVTMGLAGLWHGASWTFMAWGLYHGVGQIIHRFFAASAAGALLKRLPNWLSYGIGMLITFHFVVLGWVLFRSPDFATVQGVLERLTDVTAAGAFTVREAFLLKSYGFTAMALYGLGLALAKSGFLERLGAWAPAVRTVSYGLMVFLAIAFAPLNREPFIYFQF